MKKTYVLLSVLLIALMTAGLSYAYWTDTLTVNGTAETGNVDVKWAPGTNSDYNGYLSQVNTSIVNSKTLLFEVNNIYPDSWNWGTSAYINEGTVPAKLNFVSITLQQPGEAWDQNFTDNVVVYIGSEGASGDWIPTDSEEHYTLTEIIQNNWTLNFDEMNTILAAGTHDRTLVYGDPIEQHRFYIGVKALSTLSTGMEESVVFYITLDFLQDT
ncbi:SipW-dependent-type signal peptide-containing protein [Mycoplasmatota bacterium WC44]